MTFHIGKEFTFHAAHQLPLHDGKCKELHGHTYRARIELTGPIVEEGPQSGMVVDFAKLKAIWEEQIEPLVDHRYLNDSLPVPHTTCELIANWLLMRFRDALGPYCGLSVTLYETPTSWARVS